MVVSKPTMASAHDPAAIGPVLLFDDECGLCQQVVRLLLRVDGRARLRFAALQAPVAQAFLRAHGLPTTNFDSLVFVPEWNRRDRPEFLLRTAGVIAALRTVGGMGRPLAALLELMPARVRDAAYRGVARWRSRIFGRRLPRAQPRAEWSARFLDPVE